MSDVEGEETFDDEEAGAEELGDEEQLEDEEKELGDEEQDEQLEEEEEEKPPENLLTEEIMAESVSLLCKTGDGLAHAYVRLDIHDREITDISLLKKFIHLRYIDVSKNNLKDISPLSNLTHMLTLKADENLLTSARLEEMPYLQQASFSHNQITSTEGINHPSLEQLNLNANRIKHVTGLDATKLTRLHTLEMRGNQLESTDGIYLPNLKNLFLVRWGCFYIRLSEHFADISHRRDKPVALHFNSEGHGKHDLNYEIIAQLREDPENAATTTKRRSLELRWIFQLHSFPPQGINDKIAANVIRTLEGMSRLSGLTTLHLRENQLESLDGFAEEQKSLQYINMRGNNLNSVKEINKLKVLPTLRALALSENPLAEEDDYRLEVLISLRKIERLDKDEYTDEERGEAEEIYEQRRQEEETNEGVAEDEPSQQIAEHA